MTDSRVKLTKIEVVYHQLRHQIMTSELPPGSAVSERFLAERLQVGKAPVRVAIQRLAAEGFLSVEPRRGIRICQQSVQDILDLFQVRVVMEQLVVGNIAGSITESQTALLYDNLDEYRTAASIPDIDTMISVDFAFHRLMAEFHGNKLLSSMLNRTLDALYREIRITMKVQRRAEQRLIEHRDIVEALVHGDAQSATRTLATHLHSGQQSIMSRGGTTEVAEASDSWQADS
ncbi:MAG: GntR family transcriptional regulator, partial [Planctomycetaceae bacterium]